jgi:hypothetical protein
MLHYEILRALETDNVAILLYMISACARQISLSGELSLVPIGSVSRPGSRP